MRMSCREARRARFCLAQYTLQQFNKVHVALPGHFLNRMFTFAALDTFDHPDQSSPSCTVSSRNTVMAVSQVKPEKPTPKLLTSSVHPNDIRNSSSYILPCQKTVNYSEKKKQHPLSPSFSVSKELSDNAEKQHE